MAGRGLAMSGSRTGARSLRCYPHSPVRPDLGALRHNNDLGALRHNKLVSMITQLVQASMHAQALNMLHSRN